MMADNKNRIWFITGATTGFGRSLALEALARGGRVAATARDPGRLDPALKASDRVLGLALDVTDAGQCRRAVEATLTAWGRIDVLINNAGYGQVGAVEEVGDAEARAVFDTNVFGLLNVLRAALPAMRRAGRGTVVNIGSVGGLLARSGIGIYAATKFAVEGISEALYQELKPLGIGVMVVEPGPFRTDFSGRSLVDSAVVMEDYAGTAGERRAELRGKHGAQQGDPDKAARVIIDAIDAPEPPFHLVLGGPAMARATEKLTALLEEIERWRGPSAATDFD
ncbi:MAG: SDR family NAD(P)-dependent oxidoreductase [Rhodospirillales bacterium]|nr:SDR family NAD(P)-dependent oxidoreductase [Rhodospirillales bacterium]